MTRVALMGAIDLLPAPISAIRVIRVICVICG
jgi:hypothetical protein